MKTLKIALMSIISLSAISLSSCSKDDEPKVLEGNGIFTVEGKSTAFKYGSLLISKSSDSTSENVYNLTFRSYDNSNSSSNDTNDLCIITFKKDSDVHLSSGMEWRINCGDYDLEFHKYQGTPFSDNYDLYQWYDFFIDEDLLSGDLIIRQDGDIYNVKINNMTVKAWNREGENFNFIGINNGSFSWIGPLEIISDL